MSSNDRPRRRRRGRARFPAPVNPAPLRGVASGGLASVLAARRAEAVAAAGGPAIPAPLEPLRAVAAGADLAIDGVAPFITPNDAFYQVDTALQVPAIAPDEWRLRIHGMVDREVTLTLDQLLDYPTIERDITLTCVSNEVGGESGAAATAGCYAPGQRRAIAGASPTDLPNRSGAG